MRSSKALTAACLTVGVATAWGPLADQQAQAGTVLTVNLNINPNPTPSSDTFPPLEYGHVGFLTDQGTIVTPQGDPLHYSSLTDGSSVIYDSALSQTEFSSFVFVGLTGSALDHVVVSFNNSTFAENNSFELTFPTFSESTIAGYLIHDDTAHITSFIDSILAVDSDGNPIFPDVPQQINNDVFSADLVSFTDIGESFGSVAAFSAESNVVPLPNAAMMGGLVITLLLGKRGLSRLRQPQALA